MFFLGTILWHTAGVPTLTKKIIFLHINTQKTNNVLYVESSFVEFLNI